MYIKGRPHNAYEGLPVVGKRFFHLNSLKTHSELPSQGKVDHSAWLLTESEKLDESGRVVDQNSIESLGWIIDDPSESSF